MNRHTGLALMLIVFGALILFGRLNMYHGGPHLMSYLFPMAMVALGWLGIKNGRSMIGWILVVIGTLALLAKLSGLIAIVLAVGLIIYGVSLLKGKRSYY